jgi:hypothetical protein
MGVRYLSAHDFGRQNLDVYSADQLIANTTIIISMVFTKYAGFTHYTDTIFDRRPILRNEASSHTRGVFRHTVERWIGELGRIHDPFTRQGPSR